MMDLLALTNIWLFYLWYSRLFFDRAQEHVRLFLQIMTQFLMQKFHSMGCTMIYPHGLLAYFLIVKPPFLTPPGSVIWSFPFNSLHFVLLHIYLHDHFCKSDPFTFFFYFLSKTRARAPFFLRSQLKPCFEHAFSCLFNYSILNSCIILFLWKLNLHLPSMYFPICSMEFSQMLILNGCNEIYSLLVMPWLIFWQKIKSIWCNQVGAQTTQMRMDPVGGFTWQSYNEEITSADDEAFSTDGLLEQINVTRDNTDYLWYTT